MKRKLIKQSKYFKSKLYKEAKLWRNDLYPDSKIVWSTFKVVTKYKNVYFKDENFSHLCVWRMNLKSDWYLAEGELL
jgi:hypothetical protein